MKEMMIMDRRLVGKWYKEDMGETVNIFGETPLRMKMSFSSSGYYHFTPNCVYEKDGYLCYEINDEYYRMVYHVKYKEGNLVGFYTQHGRTVPICYEKLSDIPDDLPFSYVPTEIYVPGTEKKRIDVLRKYAEYDRSKACEYTDEYVLGGEAPKILEKYRYAEYIGGLDATNDAIVFRLLAFVCDHFGHNGSGGLGTGRTIADLIEFCESNRNQSNCRGLAILLASLLRLNGIKARHVTCLPYEDPFSDCHVVVDCLLPSGKRIMLDPTWRLYLKDNDGSYVSLPRLRELFISDEPFFANSDANHNGESFSNEYYRNYMTKNTFRFSRCTLHEDGVDGRTARSGYISLIPKDYPTENFSERTRKDFVYNDLEFWKM